MVTVPDIAYNPPVGRWEPNAQGRLEQAALDLYVEQGFDETTVAEIAARAGLTERTFFRHFADKREVLFRGRELADALGADAGELDAMLTSDDERPLVHLAARPGEISAEELAAAIGGDVGRFSPYAVYLPGGDPGQLDPIRDGLAQVQDEGSQLVARALTEVPLDMLVGTKTAGRTAAFAALSGAGRAFCFSSSSPASHVSPATSTSQTALLTPPTR